MKDMNLKDRARKLKNEIPALFLALKRKDTPFLAKVFAFLAVGYALSPIDLVPDFIPILGYIDDIVILPVLVMAALKFIPKEIFDECRKEAEGMWQDGKPKKWYYAVPIVVIWLLLLWLIVKAIFRF